MVTSTASPVIERPSWLLRNSLWRFLLIALLVAEAAGVLHSAMGQTITITISVHGEKAQDGSVVANGRRIVDPETMQTQ